jgi:hypothetical protein
MRRRVTRMILLLYPRRVRTRHGAEIAGLIDDLIAHDGRSRARLFTRLALDGLIQRTATTTTVWTAVAVLAATSLGGLAASGFAAASAQGGAPRTTSTAAPAPARHVHQTPHLDRHPCAASAMKQPSLGRRLKLSDLGGQGGCERIGP